MQKVRLRNAVVRCVTALVCAAGSLGANEISELRVELNALLTRRGDGSGFQELSARTLTGTNTYLTAAAVAPWDARRIIVATTFLGLYESRDGGATWVDLGEEGRLDPLYRGSGFFEDIDAVAYDPWDHEIVWLRLAHDRSVHAVDLSRGVFVDLPRGRGQRALTAGFRAPIDPPTLVERTTARAERRRLAADRNSFYLSPSQTTAERLTDHIAFAQEHGFNAVVIDFKDDFGRLRYDSRLEPAERTGAIATLFSARRVIDTLHAADMYVIARVVVFKDRALARYQDGRYAVWDRRRDKPWGVFRERVDATSGARRLEQVEYWVDLFSEFVWQYNIAIAEELQALGVDEIQFDYIRTPSDGVMRDAVYRFQTQSPAMEGQDRFLDDRVEALAMFLRRARERIAIPIGIDVFGFNAWYRMGHLGQDIAALAPYVDVISPMLYPSHFARDFADELAYLPRAEFLYAQGVARARRITGDQVIIRPYVQAFLIGGELNFDTPVYTDYLKHQIRGSLDAGASGFTLWNASGRYYMVARGLYF